MGRRFRISRRYRNWNMTPMVCRRWSASRRGSGKEPEKAAPFNLIYFAVGSKLAISRVRFNNFHKGGIRGPRKRRVPDFDPARDLRHKWGLGQYAVVKLRWPRATQAHENGWPPGRCATTPVRACLRYSIFKDQ